MISNVTLAGVMIVVNGFTNGIDITQSFMPAVNCGGHGSLAV